MSSHATPLADAVDADRRTFSAQLDSSARKSLGQFMTPAPIAGFMASLFQHTRRQMNLLDAGAGMGSLIAAYTDMLCAKAMPDASLAVTAVELDTALTGRLRTTLEACRDHCQQAQIGFSASLVDRDFIEYVFDLASRDGLIDTTRLQQFDAAILNPPYAKIRTDSRHRQILRHLGIEATNLYAAFLALAILLLRPGGELVAIVPRSFCNGPYFRAFRRQLLASMSLRHLHIYESRAAAFSDDAVLQENLILYAVKDSPQATVRITSSESPGMSARGHDVSYERVVRANDPDAFIHIVTSSDDDEQIELILRQPCTLASLGLDVSTGRVVDFRARSFLLDRPRSDCVPMIQPAHFDRGFVRWPLTDSRKPNALRAIAETTDLRVPNGVYVLARRFTAKEERRRIVACIYQPSRLAGSFDSVGFENHLNYFHGRGNPVPVELAHGLAAYLNSTAVDRYFRQFSGHTQVNATDLRSLRYPSLAALETLGAMIGDAIADQARVDEAVKKHLHLSLGRGRAQRG